MTTDGHSERILRFIQAEDYQPKKAQEIAMALGIGEEELGDFHDACKALMHSGRVVLGSRSTLMLPPPAGTITGTFRSNPRGFGFVIPESVTAHGDLYIPAGASGDAITGDRVLARIQKKGKRGNRMMYEGRIMRVLQRGKSRFVGELVRQFSKWMVVPDGNTLHVPIVVGDPGAKGAKPGDQVVVEILQYPREGVDARGVIVKVLGVRGQPGVDTLSIIEQHQLPDEFPAAVLEETREMVGGYDSAKAADGRDDLTKQTIITIDPVDARDFDDAISLTHLDGGRVELGVHIADVSYFVREGGALDSEARERSNSIYLPRMVIPMLPESLSNGLCSLQEREPRLTKSAFITYDTDGEVVSTRFANSVIQSAKRLTYEQASEILDGKVGRISAKVIELLKDMDKLARVIRKRRIREGMLVLETPDIELVHNDVGEVVDVVPADTSFSHTIIEMFMVEANEAVSGLLAGQGVPHLRRVHGPPEDLAEGNLPKFLKALGYELPEEPDRFDLQRLLVDVHGKPEAFSVNLAVLRSMQQAEYSPEPVGHYALASANYCHFTSPIRRYPDLTVHRLLDRYLTRTPPKLSAVQSRGPSKGRNERRGRFDDKSTHDVAERDDGRVTERGSRLFPPIPTFEELLELGELCSDNERRAESAERELIMVLILRLLESKVGETMEGTVTGVANMGVFVQLDKYLIDGMLRFDGLPDDWWEVDSDHGCVIGERTGIKIRIGDRLKVKIARVFIPIRQLDLAIAQKLSKTAGDETSRKAKRGGRDERSGRRKNKGKRGSSRGSALQKGSRGKDKRGRKRR